MTIEEQPVTSRARATLSRLKQERERRGWSQSELAERLGTTQVNISRWETGLTTPSPFFRQKLAEQFGKSLEELGLVSVIAMTNQEAGPGGTGALEPAPLVQSSQKWNVPHHRNPYFTGREEILLHLYTILNTTSAAALTQTQAISGLGGIGKTQIAVEYAYRYRDYYSAVLWVSASSREAVISDFVMLAALLDLPEQYEQDQDIVISAVKRWLASNTNWLLILDNVDDLQIIVEFLPTQSMGKVLLTTRLQALGSVAQGIEVEKMGMDEGKLLLLRRTRALTPDASLEQARKELLDQTAEIVTELDALPLALDQAGAYIDETRCGLSAYLTLYRTRRRDLLRRRGRQPVDHPEPVAATWSLSFNQVEQRNPAAADLLRLLALCSPEAIPEEILTEGAKELGLALSKAVADTLQFNDLIELLLHYSLIRRNPEERLLSVHRLVQAVLKDGMSNELARTWAERAIRAINCAFPDVKLTTWDQCQRCLPHVLLSMTHLDEYDLTFPEAADLLNKAARYLTDHAQYRQAEPLLKKALDIRKQTEEAAHPNLAHTLNDLGTLYLTQGRYPEAEPLLQQALEIRRQQLGSEHPEVAKTLNNLAFLFRKKGDYQKAERFYLEALNIQSRALSSDHPDLAETLNNMGRLYRAQGDYAKAQPYYEKALEIRKHIYGNDHPLVATSIYNLAKLYHSQGRYLQAEDYCKQALSIQERILGVDHPDIAYTLTTLGKLRLTKQRYDEAESLYQNALRIRTVAFGENHPNVAIILSNLGEVNLAQGKYLEARSLIKRSLEIREKTLGEEHPYIAYSLSNLAETYHLEGNFAEAEQLFKQVLAIREKVLGSEHPYTATTYHNLAELCFAQELYDMAESFFVKAKDIRERTLTQDHPDLADSLESMAKLFYATNRELQAGECVTRARSIRARREREALEL